MSFIDIDHEKAYKIIAAYAIIIPWPDKYQWFFQIISVRLVPFMLVPLTLAMVV
jgi:hypothetical protein